MRNVQILNCIIKLYKYDLILGGVIFIVYNSRKQRRWTEEEIRDMLQKAEQIADGSVNTQDRNKDKKATKSRTENHLRLWDMV